MSNQAVQTTEKEKAIEFIPFGSADRIKLSVKIIQNMVAVPTKSGKTCSERDALRFLMLCQAQRLNPFAGDAFLVGYDGKDGPSFSLITAHQAFLKRAETCADFEGMESGVIILSGDKDNPVIAEREGDFHLEAENIVGGWARVHRKGRRDTYRRIRMARFNKGFAQWAVDPAGMICKTAEADALRSTFPTLLGGLYLQGEQDGAAGRIVVEMSTTRPIFEAPAKLVTDAQPGQEIKGPPWVCAKCGQKNAAWAGECGRCNAAKPSGEPTADDGDLGPQPVPPSGGGFNPPTGPSSPGAPTHPYPGDFNPLKTLRDLLKTEKITEAELLDFWSATGATDGSFNGLEDMLLGKGEDWMKAQTEAWPATALAIKAAKKKGGQKA